MHENEKKASKRWGGLHNYQMQILSKTFGPLRKENFLEDAHSMYNSFLLKFFEYGDPYQKNMQKNE